MTQKQALLILQEEGLSHYNWNEEHEKRENEVVIKLAKSKSVVYVTDERASIVTGSITIFKTEEEALENFISRVRTEKILYSN